MSEPLFVPGSLGQGEPGRNVALMEATVSTQRIAGIVLLVVGVGVLIYGINASHSLADRMSDTFTGRFTEATTWYIIAGAASGLVGLLLVAFGGGGNRE